MSSVRLGWFVRLTAVMGALVAVSAGPAHAADRRWIDEGKVGILAHDIRVLGLGRPGEPGADLNVEIVFSSPPFLQALGAPRPHLGVVVNTAGATDYGYLGLTWSGRPWRPLLPVPDGLFVAGSLGVAYTMGIATRRRRGGSAWAPGSCSGRVWKAGIS